MSLENITQKKAEECFECIQEIRGLLHRPAKLGADIRADAWRMIGLIRKMKQTGLQNGSDDLDRLAEHLENICRLTNQMEAGDLMIRGDHAMQAAYKRLP